MKNDLNILFVGNDETNFLAIEHFLRQQYLRVRCHRVASGAELATALKEETWDAVLTDFVLPNLPFHQTLVSIRIRFPDLPIILVTNAIGEATAVDLLKEGVWDIVRKDDLVRLASVLRRALRDAKARRAGQGSEISYRDLFDSIADAIYVQDESGRFLDVNPGAVAMYGYPREFFIGNTPEVLAAAGMNDMNALSSLMRKAFSGEKQSLEFWGQRANGELFAQEVRLVPTHYKGQRAVIAMAREMAQLKRAEEDLAIKETWRRILIEQSRDGFVILDLDGKVHDANQTFADMLGYALEEVYQLHVWDWDVFWNRERVLAGLRASDAAGGSLETVWKRRDGTTLDVEISTNGAVFAGQQRIFCVCRDISQRKWAEQRLTEQHALLQTILDSLPMRVFWKDRELRYVGCNTTFAVDAGASSPAEVIGKDDHQLVWREQAELYRADDGQVMAFGQAKLAYDEPQSTPDGRRVWLRTSKVPLRDASGQSIGVLGLYEDITERKIAEEKLQLQQAALEAAANAMVITDCEGKIEWVNPAFTILTGYTFDEAVGHKQGELVDSVMHDPEFSEAILQNVLAGRVWHGEILKRRKDGTPFEEELTVTPVPDANGIIRHLVAVKQDITERKQAEARIRQLNRLYAVLSGINEASVRCRDIPHLFAESCRIAMEEGDFPMAWVGLLDPETQRVDPAAYSGTAGGSLERLRIALTDEICSRGPKAQALREGRIIVCRNSGNDACMHPRNEEALCLGYRSFAALPIRIKGIVHGTFNLYSATESSFDTEEIRLLERLSENIGFAMEAIETESRRKAAELALAEHQQHLEELVAARTAELESAEEKTRLILESSADGVFGLDVEGCFSFVNPAACQMMGYALEDLVGRSAHALIHHSRTGDTSHSDENCPMQRVRQQACLVRVEEDVFWRQDGQPVLVEYAANPIHKAGQVIGEVVSFRDITERKRMQDALRESEANLAHAQAIAHVGSWHLDIVNEALTWSAETYRIFGVSPETDVNPGLSAARLHPEDSERVSVAWKAALRGEVYDIVYRVVVEGNIRWVREQAQIGFDVGGNPLVAIGAVQDITEIKLAEAAREQALAEAERLARVRSEFLANMSHEIRTPLSAVLGLAQIGMRENTGRKTRDTCARILEAGRHLLGVINDILDFSKIEAGKLSLGIQPFRLADTVNEAMDLVIGRAEARGLELSKEVSNSLPEWVSGDSLRLQQILVNLLSNAIKFTERGKVSVSVVRTAENTLFRVADTGIGMDEGQMTRLFRPFVQADSSTTRKYGGSGLGLAISRDLARLMGGDIGVESKPGQGSVFTLCLPLLETAPASKPRAEQPGVTGRRLDGLRVLAAEDMEVNRLILEDILEHEGAQVHFAENGRQALEALQNRDASAFDVVLMDVQMPVMDGYTASRRIRELAPALPVIGLTAHAMPEERERCLAAGMVERVTKPINLDALVAAILRQVGKPGALATRSITAGKIADQMAQQQLQDDNRPVASQSELQAKISDGLIDWPALLRRFNGRKTFIDKLSATVQANHADSPAKLRAAVQSKELDTLAFVAHSLKGMGGNLQAHRLWELAKETEDAARAGQDAAFKLGADLADVMDSLLAELSA